MLKREDLRTTVATVTTADANIGSAVPQNKRRFIYRIKVINEYDGANLLTLGKRENGAGSTTTIDYVQLATLYDIFPDPEELHEDSVPLYIIEGAGSSGSSYLRAVTGSGNAYLTIWYIDAPA